MGRHAADGRRDISWRTGLREIAVWLVTRLGLAVLVIGGILLVNLLSGVEIPGWAEFRGGR